MISIQRVLKASSIQVFNIGLLTADHITLYFENPRCGTGEVEDIMLRANEGYAIVKFADPKGRFVYSVLL